MAAAAVGGSPYPPGIWSGVAGEVANTGLNGGPGFGTVVTDQTGPRPPAWADLFAEPTFTDKGQFEDEELANSSVNVSSYVDNVRDTTFPHLRSGAGMLMFERSIDKPRMKNVDLHRPGPHSGVSEAYSLSNVNLILYSDAGRRFFHGCNGQKILDEFRFAGVMPTDFDDKKPSTRTYNSVKKAEVINAWAVNGVEIKEGQTLWLVLGLHEDEKKEDAPTASAVAVREPMGIPGLSDSAADSLRLFIDTKKSRSGDAASTAPLSRGERVGNRFWRFTPVVTAPGHPPDTKLYMNDVSIGGVIRVGSFHYYIRGEIKLQTHMINAKSAIYPTDASDKWLTSLLSLPVLHVMLRGR